MHKIIACLLLFFTFQSIAQRVDYDKIIPTDASTDTLSTAEKLVQVAWKNHPSNEIALLEMEAAKSKKDPIALRIADAHVRAQKLQTRGEILRRYQNYVSAIEILKYRNRSQEEAHLVHLVITKSLKKGEGTLEDYNKSFIIYNEAVSSKIQSETDVAQAKNAIEELIGVQLEEVTAKKLELAKMDKKGDTILTSTGLKYIMTSKGSGDKPKAGQKVEVYYTGKFLNGREFESNRKDEPFKFTVGVQQAIPGWDEGVLLMKEGEKGILILPPKLAYGKSGIKDPSNDGQYMVPPETPVMYEIDLIDIK